MYNVSSAYLSAIASSAPQHIRGELILASGYRVALSDNIKGTPRIEKRCTESEDAFMFGQMYVGTVELTVAWEGSHQSSSFRGAQVTLEFGVDIEGSDEPEWVPLGLWDIRSAERQNGGEMWLLKGTDRLDRLRNPVGDSTVGRLRLATILDKVSRACNVVFAQTADEIAAMIGRPASSIVCVEFSQTYWEEVRQIAQLMGGFAFANRAGEIEFRKFGTSSVLTIAANRRFNLKPSEFDCGIAEVSYTDSKGRTYTAESATAGGTVRLGFSANKYIFTGSDDFAAHYADWIDPIAESFTQSWYSGTCDYYGDPALDLGDMITVTGGQRDAGPFHAAARKLAQLLQTAASLIAHGSFLPT